MHYLFRIRFFEASSTWSSSLPKDPYRRSLSRIGKANTKTAPCGALALASQGTDEKISRKDAKPQKEEAS